MGKRCWYANLLVVIMLSSCRSLHPGDLLFHVVAADNHITSVTSGQIDHVAIYMGHDSVIEAIPQKGVTTTPLHTILHREKGYYIRGCVAGADGKRTILNALSYVGRPYDSLYLADNHAIYCSELVVLSVVDHNGESLFEQSSMTFRDSTNTVPAYWQQLYARHGMEVPEGAPGTNPSEMARHKSVRLQKSIK